ncbi:protein LLP homolog [Contarinia nasturtii]|uniref:protein LLP homolog n=1 Tax=Contarinia nasturtii TaxID=265458 RepID=UPI0012D43D92|nr:protein LLP homolog [Contarinia nasturtii]
MGRTNRSRKRKAQMDRIKKERNSKKELLRLKKTLGLIDEHGNELIQKMEEVIEYKTPEQLKKEKQAKEEKEILEELAEERAEGEIVEVTNEKTGVIHRYNTKTMRDQFGSLPVWKKPRNTERKMRKKVHAQKKQFNQAWLNKFVPV